jgi:hypothetical protein
MSIDSRYHKFGLFADQLVLWEVTQMSLHDDSDITYRNSISFDLHQQSSTRLQLVEAISKMSVGPISALGRRFNSSTYVRMRAD